MTSRKTMGSKPKKHFKGQRWGNKRTWRSNKFLWECDVLDFFDEEMVAKDPESYFLTRGGAFYVARPEIIERNELTKSWCGKYRYMTIDEGT